MGKNLFRKENLSYLRDYLGYSYDKLSDLTNISIRQLKALELGDSLNPNKNTLSKLDDFMNKIFPGAFSIFESEEGLVNPSNFFFTQYQSKYEAIDAIHELESLSKAFSKNNNQHRHATAFNERFDLLFKESGLSQEEFGKTLGMTKAQVYSYRTASLANAEALAKISNIYSVSSDWLVGLSDDRSIEITVALHNEFNDLTPEAKKAVLDFIGYARSKYPKNNTQ